MSDPTGRLEGELAKLGAEHEPPAGWQARVLAAVEAPPRRRRWWFALPAVAVAVAIALVIGLRGPSAPPKLALVLVVVDGGTVVRGGTAKVGDTVRATATGGRHRAVWIYRDDRQLVAACPGTACRDDGVTLVAEAVLRAPGRYTVVALDAKAPLPPPAGSLDSDLAAAHAAGATSRTDTIDVR